MNTTQKIGLVSGGSMAGNCWRDVHSRRSIHRLVERVVGIRPRGNRAYAVDLEDDWCPRRHRQMV